MTKARIATIVFAVLVLACALWFVYGRYVAIGAAEHKAEGEEIAAFVQERASPFVSSGGLTSANDAERNAAFEALFAQIQSPSLFRLKAWTDDYQVLWSDLADIIGTKHSENEAVLDAYRGEVSLSVGQPKLEHVSERQVVQLLEVYTPVKNAQGDVVLVVETYNVGKPLTEAGTKRLMTELLAALVAAALLAVIGRFAFRKMLG